MVVWGTDLDGEGDHAPHAVGEAGHGLPHPLGVADHHQLGPLQPVLVPQQRIPEPHTPCTPAHCCVQQQPITFENME